MNEGEKYLEDKIDRPWDMRMKDGCFLLHETCWHLTVKRFLERLHIFEDIFCHNTKPKTISQHGSCVSNLCESGLHRFFD